MFKFKINQEVWFLKNDRVQSGNIRVRQYTESSQRLQDEVEQFKRTALEKTAIIYALERFNNIDPNWQLREDQLFCSKQELLESL
jgi:hypothetical protein